MDKKYENSAGDPPISMTARIYHRRRVEQRSAPMQKWRPAEVLTIVLRIEVSDVNGSRYLHGPCRVNRPVNMSRSIICGACSFTDRSALTSSSSSQSDGVRCDKPTMTTADLGEQQSRSDRSRAHRFTFSDRCRGAISPRRLQGLACKQPEQSPTVTNEMFHVEDPRGRLRDDGFEPTLARSTAAIEVGSVHPQHIESRETQPCEITERANMISSRLHARVP